MRLTTNKTKNGISYYIIRSVRRDGKRSSEVVERLGTEQEIMKKYHCTDAAKWAKEHLDELNHAETEKQHKVLVPLRTDVLIPLNKQNSYNVGYLFLQKIYYDLRLPNICKKISKDHAFSYDLDSILSRLVYERILNPSSKLSCYEQSSDLLEPPAFELHQIYRALSVIADESDTIQAELYEASRRLVKRETGILYYDCTNYFFETECQEGLKQYGPSKEHRPNPIVEMGLFMDRSGIPLAFCIHPGNTNEQTTLIPLEEQIMKDFSLSRFIVCTDAGLSSERNRKFNNFGGRCFITTQSIKKLSKELRHWCLDPTGWHLKDSQDTYDISRLADTAENRSRLFYKQLYVEGSDGKRDIDFDQTLIVTYSLKYRNYQQQIRSQQISRALKTIETSPKRIDKHNQNDYRRFIKKTPVTADGEYAAKKIYEIDQDIIQEEAQYDGFYAVYTNLDDDPCEIAAVNQGRWEIEESFRIMKSEFEARPVYLKRDDRIKAHFTTCFIALLIYRILEWKLDRQFTCDEIISTLRKMRVTDIGNEGYIPSYTRTDLTDALHEYAGFRTDYELIRKRTMKGICRHSKE
ncbi:MAG: IS1634 family transposase [Lachnospiraceae bacterium]